MTHKEAKGHIRSFMRDNYTDERLAQLLAHAQDGKLAFNSCCCFIGIPTVDHAALCGYREIKTNHQTEAYALPGAATAEQAFNKLWHPAFVMDLFGCSPEQDVIRRRILIPIVRAEMRRRDRLAVLLRARGINAEELASAVISKHEVAK